VKVNLLRSVALEAREVTRRAAVDRLLDRLRRGLPVRDTLFDSILPIELRRQSRINWTPVSVARRAAQLLVSRPGARVLDVGSGAGKFCLVGALTTSGRYVGVERRSALAKTAAEIVRSFPDLDVRYVDGDMADLDWSPYDAIYLFNPFYENMLTLHGGELDRPTGLARFNHYVGVVESKLLLLRHATRVVTYHGFGGEFPDCFERVLKEEHESGNLELWVKS